MMILASVNFICSSLHNRESRIYRRETVLREAVMRVNGWCCSQCGLPIPQGAKYANTSSMQRLCGACYAPMTEAQAYVSVHFEGLACPTPRRLPYRESWLYDFDALGVVCFRADGRELRFTNLRRAMDWVDWEWEHGHGESV